MTEQNWPLERHSQYNFKHFVFLQEQTFVILCGKLDLSVKQFGQHSGAHGNGERKQLQL
jgi:hypothetical protein